MPLLLASQAQVSGRRCFLQGQRNCFQSSTVLRKQRLHAAHVTAAAPELAPPRTYNEIIRQARDSLRRFRELKQSGTDLKKDPAAPYRLELNVPLPVSKGSGEDALAGPFGMLDEQDWPGGYAQKFRALKPMVDEILAGYDAEYLGMLESPAEGIGCWTTSDTTVVTLVGNATFPAFAKLCEGGYGSKPLEPSHTIIVVNPEWTSSKDIGQPWDRKLKRVAKQLLDDAEWSTLYSCDMVRTSRGGRYGMVVGSYNLGWWVFKTEDDSSASVGSCILYSKGTLDRTKVLEALGSVPS